MRKDWIEICRKMSATPATYWSGGKKILRNQTFSFPDPQGPMTIEELGYTRTKMSLLVKGYLHRESRDSALSQWNNRKNYREKGHWSVGFSCYNHILKSHSRVDSPDNTGSIMGPCLQAVTISHTIKGIAEIDVFYRTTEILKKFPADLVLIRDHLLEGFDFDRTPLGPITFHIANMTVSPTYLPTVLTVSPDPIGFLQDIQRGDPLFYKGGRRWILKLLTGEESRFNQARRTQRAIKSLMFDEDQEALIKYLEKNP